MKNTGSGVFELIRQMNGSEKRYFKLFASFLRKKVKTQLVELFEAIDKQKLYDEQALKKKFSHHRMLNLFFEKAKRDLFRLILKSLRNYHEGKYTEQKVANKFFEASILLDKGLFQSAKKILDKALTDASQSEFYWLMLRIREEQMHLMNNRQFFPLQDEETIENTFRNFFSSLKNYENIIHYYKGPFSIMRSLQKEGFARRINRPKIEEMVKVMSADIKRMSPRSKLHYYMFRVFYHFERDEFNQSFDYASLSLELFDKNYFLSEYPQFQFRMLNYYLNNCIFLRRHASMLQAIEQMERIKTNSGVFQKSIGDTIINMKASYFIRTGDFTKAKKILEPALSETNPVGKFNMHLKLLFYYHLSIMYFGTEEHKKSLKWLNRIVNESIPDFRMDLLVFGRVLELIVNFELKNMDLVEHRTRSLYRFLLKHKRLFRFEDCLLGFFRKKLFYANNQEELLAAFTELDTNLKKIFEDPFEQKALVDFNFVLHWLTSKIENRPFAEIIREKNKNS